ncbi:MAG TPA: hypothetical protein PLM85_08980 [Nitrosomonas sp.]|nr:hypothetical protein [Nitrosomonas sp.]HNG37193.1 hypothetical protein [Nitrosomonas sp.]
MKIKSSSLPPDVLAKITNPDPLDGEDILIENEDGSLLAAIIQPKAYSFFLQKVEEKEDELDSSLHQPYDKNATSLDDLLGE